uniref:Uncharacterized protein n=1 Tax=Anguilla anguilla TaxID=7936 RepID=A0A0E9SFB0_ANGAN
MSKPHGTLQDTFVIHTFKLKVWHSYMGRAQSDIQKQVTIAFPYKWT